MSGNKGDKKHRNNPMIDFADSINHSMIGDLGLLAKGGCLTKLIIIIVIIIIIIIMGIFIEDFKGI